MPVARRAGGDPELTVLGGGISGLALALAAGEHGRGVAVVESQEVFGGLLRTINLGGHLFDTGPHGIYCPDPELLAWFQRLLGDELRLVERNSYTLFRGRPVAYPLTVRGALAAVTWLEAARVLLEAALLRPFKGPPRQGSSFEEWGTHSFGATLYRLFFEQYTQKVWGLPCRELSAAWVSAHLPANSLLQVLYDRLRDKNLPIGFVSRFYYGACGAGRVIERLLEEIARLSLVKLLAGMRFQRLTRGAEGWTVRVTGQGAGREWTSARVVSTIPVGPLLEAIEPKPPEEVLAAARGLRFRNLLLVLLVVDTPRVSSANWLYVPDPGHAVSRVSEFKNMIASMQDRPDTSLAAELYCWPTDPLWSASEEEITRLAVADLESLRLMRPGQVKHARVLRVPNAYPVFDLHYSDRMDLITDYLSQLGGLHLLGRTGAFQYLDQAGCVKQALALEQRAFREQAVS